MLTEVRPRLGKHLRFGDWRQRRKIANGSATEEGSWLEKKSAFDTYDERYEEVVPRDTKPV